jgi:hypothetical protein
MTTMFRALTCNLVMIGQSVSGADIGSYPNVICTGMCTQKSTHARQASVVGDTQEQLGGKRTHALTTEYALLRAMKGPK